MASRFVKRLLVASASSTLVGIGGAVYYRHTLLDAATGELLVNQRRLKSALAEAEALRETADRESAAQITELEGALGVVTNLWDERHARLTAGLAAMDGYLDALPEALTILRGLRRHASHAAGRMPDFYPYEAAAAKLHDLGLLLRLLRLEGEGPATNNGTNTACNHGTGTNSATAAPRASGDRAGQRAATVAELVYFMFHGEPLVVAACQAVSLNAKVRAVPASRAELAGTLRVAVADVEAALTAEGRRRADAAAAAAGSASAASGPEGNFFLFAANASLNRLRASASASATDGKNGDADGGAGRGGTLSAAERDAAWALHTAADVRAAVKYATALEASLARDATASPLLATPSVRLALDALDAWRGAAVAHLVQQQSLVVLEAYYTIAQHGLVAHRPTAEETEAAAAASPTHGA